MVWHPFDCHGTSTLPRRAQAPAALCRLQDGTCLYIKYGGSVGRPPSGGMVLKGTSSHPARNCSTHTRAVSASSTRHC